MKYFKHAITGEVFAFESDGSQDDYIKPEMVEMSAVEIEAHLNPVPTTEQLASQIRIKRDQLLNDSQWLVLRHRDEVDAAEPTTLTHEQYLSLLSHRQQLRDITLQAGFPNDVVFPAFQV